MHEEKHSLKLYKSNNCIKWLLLVGSNLNIWWENAWERGGDEVTSPIYLQGNGIKRSLLKWSLQKRCIESNQNHSVSFNQLLYSPPTKSALLTATRQVISEKSFQVGGKDATQRLLIRWHFNILLMALVSTSNPNVLTIFPLPDTYQHSYSLM